MPNEVRKGLHFSLANTLIKELSAELTSTLEPFSLLPALRSQCFCEMAERRKTILRNEICIEDRWKKKENGKETETKEERRGGRREKGRGWRENGREKGGRKKEKRKKQRVGVENKRSNNAI